MSKVRVVIAEMEGSDEAVLAAIRTCVGAAPTVGVTQELAPASPPVAAIAEPTGTQDDNLSPAFVNAVRKQLKRAKKPPKATVQEEDPCTPGQKPFLDLLRKAPLTSGEVLGHFPKMSPASVYAQLGAMRKAGIIETRRDPADGESKNFVRLMDLPPYK